MTAESASQLLDGIGKVAWPVIALVTFTLLFPSIKRLVDSRAFTIKVGDWELSAQDASEQLNNDIKDLLSRVATLESRAGAPLEGEAAPAVGRAPSPDLFSVLWVDDHPENNAYQIQRLRGDDDVEVVTALSTNEAMSALQSRRFDAVISDMGRKEGFWFNQSAGLGLLKRIRASDPQIPVFFYSTSRSLRAVANEIAAAGASATTSPVELLRMLREQRRASRSVSPQAATSTM